MVERMEYVWGAFVLRFSLGLLFLVAGINKFVTGLAGARQSVQGMFEGSWLPAWMVGGFATVLPFIEVIIGALLIVGLFRFVFLIVGSLLMIGLAFGTMVAGKSSIAANNMLYVLMFAAALLTSHFDRLSLDRLIFRGSK